MFSYIVAHSVLYTCSEGNMSRHNKYVGGQFLRSIGKIMYIAFQLFVNHFKG